MFIFMYIHMDSVHLPCTLYMQCTLCTYTFTHTCTCTCASVSFHVQVFLLCIHCTTVVQRIRSAPSPSVFILQEGQCALCLGWGRGHVDWGTQIWHPWSFALFQQACYTQCMCFTHEITMYMYMMYMRIGWKLLHTYNTPAHMHVHAYLHYMYLVSTHVHCTCTQWELPLVSSQVRK